MRISGKSSTFAFGYNHAAVVESVDTKDFEKTKENFQEAAAHSKSIAGMCRFLGVMPSGGNYKIMHAAIEKYSLDVSHFTGQDWNVGLKFRPKKPKQLNDVLVNGSNVQSYRLKNRLLRSGLKAKCCECCGLTSWQGKDIPLELHHKNGNSMDNRIENLQLLCPNCHALTENYRGLNKSAARETLQVELL